MIDVLDGDTLDLAFTMKADVAKCIFLADKLIFVGSWNNQVQVYDVSADFKLVKTIKTKGGVRSLTQIEDDLIVAGENDGFIDLISISTLQVVIGKRFDTIGHIYQVQPTCLRSEVVICSYTGVHFVKILQD